MAKNPADSSSSQVIDYLKDLDQRVSNLESAMKPYIKTTEERNLGGIQERGDGKPDAFEIHIGEYWFAYVGIAILVIAFVFLLSMQWSNLHPVLPSLMGTGICVLMIGAAIYTKTSFKFISINLWGAAFVVSFISVLRLFHFGEPSLMASGYLEYFLLTFLCLGLVAFAYSKKSPYLYSICLTLMLLAGLVINIPGWTLTLNALVALGIVFYSRELEDPITFIYGTIAVYAAHFIWMLGNPLMTGGYEVVANPAWNQIYILIYALIFSLILIIPDTDKIARKYIVANAMANGVLAFVLFNLSFILNDVPSTILPKILFFVVFFGLALAFWKRLEINFSMVLFTLLAHSTISIGFVQTIASPDIYVILIWQSLLVLANALWFSSQFITISNFLLYIVLFLAYTAASGFAGIISVSFGFVALFSARLIRAYEIRLGSSYNILINFYLAITFVSLPFALWKAIPHEWVAFPWLGVTLLYYGLSVMLKSQRYRWMGHLTLIATIIYTILLATMGMEPGQRILTFLALGVVLVTVSGVYTRIRKQGSLRQEPFKDVQ
ncbi:MAG: hypothetical protein ISR87_13265 [Candidatus Marinimicrobia bacterium]|nr:hypothetical protein [FCB group bacterium]MBL7026411.1 hypothetical protein [Candidatus Neomarinimicrobiota bacterium]